MKAPTPTQAVLDRGIRNNKARVARAVEHCLMRGLPVPKVFDPRVQAADEAAATKLLGEYLAEREAGLFATFDKFMSAVKTPVSLADRIRNATPEQKAEFAAPILKVVDAARAEGHREGYHEGYLDAAVEFRNTQVENLQAMREIRKDLEVIKALPVPGGPIVRRVPGLKVGPRPGSAGSDAKTVIEKRVAELEAQIAITPNAVEKAELARQLAFAKAALPTK